MNGPDEGYVLTGAGTEYAEPLAALRWAITPGATQFAQPELQQAYRITGDNPTRIEWRTVPSVARGTP